MMNKQGFSLIELLVGLVLSSIIGAILFNSFFQSARTLRMVDEYAELDTGIAVVLNQFERDLAGACMPAYEPGQKKEEEEKTPAPEKGKDADKGAEGEKGKKEKEGKESKEKKPTFIAKTKKDKQLDFVTFITTNPRSRFVSPLPKITPKPSLVRVMYKLRDSKEHKGAFVLLRQESTNLDVASFAKKSEKRPQELVVCDAVHECLVEFIYREEKEGGKMQTVQEWGAQKGESKKPETKKPEGEKKDEGKEEATIPPLPQMVKITLTIWDARFAVKRSIQYLMPLYSTYVEPQKEKRAAQVAAMTDAVMPSGGSQPAAKQPVFQLPTVQSARPNGAGSRPRGGIFASLRGGQ